MVYPKPLSEKSLERMYREAGISGEVRDFLHKLFAAAVNLYGTAPMELLRNIYGQLPDAPKLRKKDLMAFSLIARREEHSYRVFEIDEIYSEEPRRDRDRYVMAKELVSCGYGKFFPFYRLTEQLVGEPYCLVSDFLSYAEPVPTPQETALRNFLGNLTSEAEECVPGFGDAIPNENKGKKLSEFSFLNSHERLAVELCKRKWERDVELAGCFGAESEKIMYHLKEDDNIGMKDIAELYQDIIRELTEVGVIMNMMLMRELVYLVSEYHNNSRLWCLKGWTPNELTFKFRGSESKPTMIFGPGMERAFEDGSLNRDEIEKMMREKGFNVQ